MSLKALYSLPGDIVKRKKEWTKPCLKEGSFETSRGLFFCSET